MVKEDQSKSTETLANYIGPDKWSNAPDHPDTKDFDGAKEYGLDW